VCNHNLHNALVRQAFGGDPDYEAEILSAVLPTIDLAHYVLSILVLSTNASI
jgi:hypothetical protein